MNECENVKVEQDEWSKSSQKKDIFIYNEKHQYINTHTHLLYQSPSLIK